MKNIKIILLLSLMFISAPVLAQTCSEVSKSMCSPVPKVNGPISSTLSKITGMNAIISTALESQVKKELNNALKGKFKVNITPFGAKSMLQGKFRKITAHSDTAIIDNVYLSNVSGESLCEYNHFIYKDGKVYTNENFLLSFNAEITSADLQKTIVTPELIKYINSINQRFGTIFGNKSLFKIFDPKAEIKNNRIVISLKALSPLSFNEPVQVSTSVDMKVENGKILFTDIRTTPSMYSASFNAILPIINKYNMTTVNTTVLNNSKSSVKLNDISIANDKIIVKGLVIVPKNYYND